jgi:hypothetical protein
MLGITCDEVDKENFVDFEGKLMERDGKGGTKGGGKFLEEDLFVDDVALEL